MMDSLPQKIRQAREEAEPKLTQVELARLIGESPRQIQRYELGEATDIGVETLRRIAEVTGKPLAFFVTDRVAA